MTEQIVRELVDGVWVTRAANEGGGGSTAGAARVLGPFPFAFDTAGLNNGVMFYTPTVGDVLLDAWIEVSAAFDGTTPFADIGTFDGSSRGVFGDINTALKLAAADDESLTAGYLSRSSSDGATPTAQLSLMGALFLDTDNNVSELSRCAPGRFTAATPWKIVASQDGLKGGTAIDSTTGAGAVYLVVATPSLT